MVEIALKLVIIPQYEKNCRHSANLLIGSTNIALHLTFERILKNLQFLLCKLLFELVLNWKFKLKRLRLHLRRRHPLLADNQHLAVTSNLSSQSGNSLLHFWWLDKNDQHSQSHTSTVQIPDMAWPTIPLVFKTKTLKSRSSSSLSWVMIINWAAAASSPAKLRIVDTNWRIFRRSRLVVGSSRAVLFYTSVRLNLHKNAYTKR